ncbi:hypothetical protein KR044_003202, partial [Drosophila immigrans]
KIGSKLYYVEKEEKLSWFKALMTCHQKGGRLVNLRSLEEIRAVHDELEVGELYWVDLINIADGKFRSLATGELKATYPLWHKGEPNNARHNEHCVHGKVTERGVLLFDDPCSLEYLFICEFR